MRANKFEAFEMEVVHRSQIQNADYNPRKISKEAQQRLKKFLKKHGLWCPLIWNERTGNLIGGHQRILIMDTLMRTDDYNLTVSKMDVDESTEAKGNVFLNNPSAQGEWDFETLAELKDIFPDLSYTEDFGFSEEEVSLFIEDDQPVFEYPDEEGGSSVGSDRDALLPPPPSATTEEEKEEFREAKRKARETAKEENLDGRGYSYVDSDYTLSVIFSSAAKKREFLEILELDPAQKRIVADELLKVLL